MTNHGFVSLPETPWTDYLQHRDLSPHRRERERDKKWKEAVQFFNTHKGVFPHVDPYVRHWIGVVEWSNRMNEKRKAMDHIMWYALTVQEHLNARDEHGPSES